jgi:hypothetical protein
MKKIYITFIALASFAVASPLTTFADGGLNQYEQAALDAMNAGTTVNGKHISVPASVIAQMRNTFMSQDFTKQQILGMMGQYQALLAQVEAAGIDVSGMTSIDQVYAALSAKDKAAATQKVTDAAGDLGLTVGNIGTKKKAKSGSNSASASASADDSSLQATITDKSGRPVFTTNAVLANTGNHYTGSLVALIVLAVAGVSAFFFGRKEEHA